MTATCLEYIIFLWFLTIGESLYSSLISIQVEDGYCNEEMKIIVHKKYYI